MKGAIILIVGMVTLAGCYYDVEEELYLDTGCDTTDVTYSGTVLPIIEGRCYKCHDQVNNNGNVTLEGYDNLKRYANNGQLLGAVKHQAGFSAMPKNESPLLSCEIEKIEKWIDDGGLNN
jgi:hypothetical protein